MHRINARRGNRVNAHCVIHLPDHPPMAKKSQTPPSPFWERMTAAWAKHGLPITQNGVATRLNMSQGSTRRWFTGDGRPDTDTLLRIAELGHVSLDWLLTGALPRERAAPNSDLFKLLTIWQAADEQIRAHLLKVAQGLAALEEVTAELSPGKSRANRAA